ncbi:MAG: hypothetical protein CSB23_04450 [Deltaproteobacteria bacterium]|nr:MAG: hypothetical protein CSB23_04450 [Deltaproteobacteria bacterium]
MKRLLFLVLAFMVQLADPWAAISEEEALTPMQGPAVNADANRQAAVAPQSRLPSGELYDIYGVVSTPSPFPYLYAALAVFAGIVVSALLVYLVKNSKKPKAKGAEAVWDAALRALAEARALHGGQEDGRLYMEAASQILRLYVERRFSIPSTRQTTREFLVRLVDMPTAELARYKEDLQNCLELADMSKFACKSQNEENINSVETAITRFVLATRPTTGKGG